MGTGAEEVDVGLLEHVVHVGDAGHLSADISPQGQLVRLDLLGEPGLVVPRRLGAGGGASRGNAAGGIHGPGECRELLGPGQRKNKTEG